MATLEMNVRQVNSDFQAIKNKIVEKGVNVEDGTKTSEYASKVNDVYEAGKQEEYNAFWDAYQKNGTKTNYLGAFCGNAWTKETFKPKHPIGTQGTKTNGTYLFYHFNDGDAPLDFVKHCEDNNIVIDFSTFHYLVSGFAYARVSRLGVIDFKSITTTEGSYAWSGLFTGCADLVTIDKLVFYETNPDFHSGIFTNCTKLENITVEGVIAKNGLNLQGCSKLSKASIESVINCLSTTTSGLSITLPKKAVNNAFTTEEWAALIATKPNWTINLI